MMTASHSPRLWCLQVRWCRSSNGSRMLLSTNDKTIKLWKVPSVAALSRRCIL